MAAWTLLAGFIQPPLHEQSDSDLGRIAGTLVGRSGAVYQVGTLRPGEYAVTATGEAFQASETSDVVVNVGHTVAVPIRLALEPTHVSIEVTASLVDATLPSSSNVVADEAFNKLPINGRRFHDFVLLTPSVQIGQSGHLSFAAQRGVYTNVMVDGTDYNQAFSGGIQGGARAGSIITPPQSAIQQFQAITSGFTAEYGRTISGVVNVSTKSGGNEFHRDAFYQIRHPDLGRTDPFGVKVLERLQQFGGSIGGPLKRNKAFWFLRPKSRSH